MQIRIFFVVLVSICFASNAAAQKFTVSELLQIFKAESSELMVSMGKSKGILIKLRTDSTVVIQNQHTQTDSTFEKLLYQKDRPMLQAYCYDWRSVNKWIEEIEKLGFENLGHSDDDLFNIFYVKENVILVISAEKKTLTGITILTIMPKDL